ncbi:MAG: hypothetical protein ACI4HI_01270 [Lachnospiraceae bacterium]
MKRKLVVSLLAVMVSMTGIGCGMNPYLSASNVVEAGNEETSGSAEKQERERIEVSQGNSQVAGEGDEGRQEQERNSEQKGAKNEVLSSNWGELEYIFDGKKYQLPTSYKELEKNGWSVDLSEYGYEDGYTLNPGDQTFGSICLKNKKYNKKVSVKIGFVNHTEKAQDILDCDIWCMDVDVSFGFEKLDNTPDMQIANGIQIGSSEDAVIAAFGEPEEKYVDKEYNYRTYYYRNPETYQRMTLNIDGKEGVTRIALEKY